MTIDTLIRLAFEEDMPKGDLTTDSLNLEERPGRARLVAKEDLVVSGQTVFMASISHIEPNCMFHWKFENGDFVLKNQVVCQLKGDLAKLLLAERVALNFLGKLSGTATLTRCFADRIKQYPAKILDTRKTTPGFRQLQKQAVVHGGGTNHRMNLSESVLIKENHIRAKGSLEDTVRSIKEKGVTDIEVEVTDLEEIKTAIDAGGSRLLLDNMDNETLKKALEIIPQHIQTEASGNMSLDRVESVAALGVDFISVGAITHSAPNADFSLLFEWD